MTSRKTPAAAESAPGVTDFLVAWGRGDASALDQLVPLVHGELRRLARREMRRERDDHTLQTTALVNEAYLRLVDLTRVRWQDRAHFFAMSARLMRRILVDHARARESRKRGGGASAGFHSMRHSSFPGSAPRISWRSTMRCRRWRRVDARKSQVVELRFFGGLSVDETAEALRRLARNGHAGLAARQGLAAAGALRRCLT